MPSLLEFVILIAAAACVLAVAMPMRERKRGTGKGGGRKLGTVQFSSSGSLLTAAERTAFIDLARALSKRGYVCPKVRIADLINVRSENRSQWQTAFNRIACKHVDFAIISMKGEILFAVEIDDRSHERADRKRRDKLVNSVFDGAGIPLIRVAPGKLRSSADFSAVIERFWPTPPPEQTVDDAAAHPLRAAQVG